MFPTLAYQLADFDKEFKLKLLDILYLTPEVAGLHFDAQFEQLIRQPWTAAQESSSPRSNKVLVVLDAIDECDSTGVLAVQDLLDVLSIELKSMPGKFLVFLTSRLLAHVQSAFEKQAQGDFIMQDVDRSDIDGDMNIFLRYHLSHPPADVEFELPKGWPEEKYTVLLIADCGRSFIYASTALRFIFDDCVCDPSEQLEALVARMDKNPKDNPYFALDELYCRVLRYARSKLYYDKTVAERIQPIIATLALLRGPLPMKAFAQFLKLDEKDIREVLQHFCPIIIVPGPDSEDYPHCFHPSFADFIKSPKRYPDVDSEKDEARMLLRCFEVVVRALTRNMMHIERAR